MIEQDPPDVFGHTLFCDDIRQEISGKLIFIGVYHGVMVVHGTFPIALSRLCFSISITQKADLFSPTVGIRIFVPGDSDDAPSIEAEAGESIEGAALKQAEINSVPESERKFVQIFASMQFENFQIKEAGLIRVRADVRGKRYKIGSLRVITTPNKILTT
jgi:hypothetical protein